jgi:large subunit ribosomal protein L6
MSRVGKKPVDIPSGVQTRIEGRKLIAKGPKGELSFEVPEEVEVKVEGNVINLAPRSESKQARSSWGMSRSMLDNVVTGVSKGFEKKLEITGVGYRAAIHGKSLQLSLGYSHDVNYAVPAGVTITTPKPTEIVVAGIDKQQVGQVAAHIRDFRRPEPYKGKGVKYENEFIFRKEGKKK